VQRDLSANGGFRFNMATDTAGFSGARPSAGAVTQGPNGVIDLWDSHIEVTVTSTGITAERVTYEGPFRPCSTAAHLEQPAYQSCMGAKRSAVDWATVLGTGRTAAEERQNIANWYQYYRRRAFIPRAAIAEVVRGVPSLRYGLSMINNYGDLFVPFPAATANYAVHNQDLLSALFAYPQAAVGTPLRRALARVGEYYDGELSGVEDPYISQCQQSFTLLLTDGYWNGADPSAVIGDSDGDGLNGTLADVAHYYYEKDLSSLPNEVPVFEGCDASQPNAVCDLKDTQHMVTFTLAFGVTGLLNDTNGNGWPNPFLREADNWGNPAFSAPQKIDDLWHAAYNSRGAYISAKTPTDVREGLIDAINNINSRKGSGSAVAVNAGSISSDAIVFAATFDPTDWTGDLQAYNLDLATGEVDQSLWSAQAKLSDQAPRSRQIITFREDTQRGVAFQWPRNFNSPRQNELSPTQVAALLTHRESQPVDAYGKALVAYLRGDRAQESASAGAISTEVGFRPRTKVLADIVESDPVYVGQPGRRYPDNWGENQPENSAPYSAFRTQQRMPMVYVGGNGGMLHGFGAQASGADAGRERLAFIPAAVVPRLANLAQPSYGHEYFVNATPVAEDVYFASGSQSDQGWRTILVGGLGAGGQSVYALDVTDPSRFEEGVAEDIVLWEFTDPDLGYTFGEPAVGRLANGRWAVFFGSGINNTAPDGSASTSGNAFLFIVDAQTGQLIRKFDTRVGVAQDPLAEQRPNGLWTPALVDANGDFVVDKVFAGDFFGNMWQWDLAGDQVAAWDFAPAASEPTPLFQARNGQGIAQPITSRPEVGFHPNRQDLVVYFGTGQYLTVNDNLVNQAPVQSFYAVANTNGSTVTRAALQQQVIEAEFSVANGLDLRQTTERPVDWATQSGWYLDLTAPGSSTNSRGERIVKGPLLRGGKVIFPTLIPAGDSCSAGGSGWIMELNALSGARLATPPIDVNDDGLISSADALPLPGDEVLFPSGFSDAKGGIPERPAILLETQRREKKYIGQSSGRVLTITEDPGGDRVGRQSWRQLQ
jgi:type IV pilus assembly protein PilY1